MAKGEGMGEGKGACGACGITCVKYLLFFFNILFWLSGLAILGIGIWIRVDKNFEEKLGLGTQLDYLYTAAYIIIGLGAFIALVGFLGCCGAIKESQCMLATFFVVLLLLFCGLLAVGIWAIIKRDDIKEDIGTYLLDQIDDYDSKDTARDFMNTIQKELKCCGAKLGIPDWASNPKGLVTCESFTDPCQEKIIDFFEEHVYIIGGVVIGIAVIMLMGMIFSMCLCCAIKRGEGKEY